MTTPKVTNQQNVTWRLFSGTTEQILIAIQAEEYPREWGPADLVRQFIIPWIPTGNGWNGEVRVTGYRTPLNDLGTGTAFLSVHWEPKKGAGA